VKGHPIDHVERRPLTCIWEITRACNLRCIHCENQCGERSAKELSTADMAKVARDLFRLGCRQVDLTGGEPLLRSDWADLCGMLVESGLKVALITNGLLLDQDSISRALAAGVAAIGISIDGLQETHDRIRLRPSPGPSPWQQTMAALERVLPRLETVVITQVNQRSLPELPALYALLSDVGVRRWQLQLTVPVGRVREIQEPFVIAPSDLEELIGFITRSHQSGRFPRIDVSDSIGYYTEHELGLRGSGKQAMPWLGCQAGIRLVAITYDGRVRGCSALPPEFDAGDLHDETMEAIWQDASRFAYATHFDDGKLCGGCACCQVAPLCRAGCTTMAYWSSGTIYDNPFCLLKVRQCKA
jgi:radical SAM protein with 4Fe4S-binding SPASM domain